MSTRKTVKEAEIEKLSTYDLIIGILAAFSLVILAIPYFVQVSASTAGILNSTENLLCIVFLFDFFRSLFHAQIKRRYFLNEGGWVDLLGSMPIDQFAVFRAFRLFRVIRVLRSLRSNDYRRILTRRIAQSTLLLTLVLALLLVFIISAIVLFAEKGAPHANILTYGDAVWWALVTVATVGYGDYYPVTPLGRAMAVILMFFGIGVIGVFTSYLSSLFISIEKRRRESRDQE